MTPQTVNAYYNPTTNEICFPTGILQRPFFDPKADEAYNYGAIGVVIGHEMTHGFDDQGRQYDANGYMNDWWTASDAKGFEERAKLYADFFSNIKVLPDLNANSEFTLGRRRYLNRKQDCRKCYVTVTQMEVPCSPGRLHKEF